MLLFKLLQIPEEIKLCLWFSWGGGDLKWPESLEMDFPCVLITSSLEMMLKNHDFTNGSGIQGGNSTHIWQRIMELGESYLEKRSSFSSSISLSISSAIHHGVVSVKMFNLRPPYVLPSWICICPNLLRCKRNKICPIKNLFCHFFTAIYADVEKFSGI